MAMISARPSALRGRVRVDSWSGARSLAIPHASVRAATGMPPHRANAPHFCMHQQPACTSRPGLRSRVGGDIHAYVELEGLSLLLKNYEYALSERYERGGREGLWLWNTITSVWDAAWD